jgi:hypothetical protein
MSTIIEEGKNVQKNSLLLMFSVSLPGLHRSVGRESIADKNNKDADDFAVSIDADTDMVRVTKEILDAIEFDDVVSHWNSVKRALARVGYRGVFKDGCYCIPSETLSDVDAFLDKREREGKVLWAKFIAAYPARKAEAKRLRALYKEDDYPSPAELNASYKVRRRFFTFDTPEALRDINVEVYNREKKRTEEFWQETGKQINNALIQSFNNLVSQAADKLSNGKVITNAGMQKIEDFLEVFEKRNITKNTDLIAIANKAKRVLKGIDATALQEGQVRLDVSKGFDEIRKSLEKMMVDRPTSRIRL